MGPRWGRPLLVKKDANFTHLVADRVTGLDGATYTVLFIGTGGPRGHGLGRWGLGEGLCAPGGESLLLFSLHLSSPTPPQEMAGCSRP